MSDACIQAVQHIAELPDSALDASAYVLNEQLDAVRAVLSEDGISALAIVLPGAGPEHSDWRLAFARDLAREFAPQRVNVVARGNEAATQALLVYLEGAPGVTGHYLEAHD